MKELKIFQMNPISAPRMDFYILFSFPLPTIIVVDIYLVEEKMISLQHNSGRPEEFLAQVHSMFLRSRLHLIYKQLCLLKNH